MTFASPTPLSTVIADWAVVVVDWKLDLFERSILIGGYRDPTDGELQPHEILCGEIRMRLCVEIAPVIAKRLGSAIAVRAWLRRASPALGNQSPLEVMARSPEWIRWFIDNLQVAK